MSEIQVGQINSTDGSTAITTGADGYVSFAKTQIGGRRNLIINGAMQVWQRTTSKETVANNDYIADRFRIKVTGTDGNLDVARESTIVPEGFGYSMKLSMDASESSIGAADFVRIQQFIEGQNVQQLKKGTSNAEKVTLSFWVRSSVASTYTVNLGDADNSRNISKAYTINAADTWEYKTLTFDGDTTGTLDNDNQKSFEVDFWIDAGSDYTSGTFATSWESSTSANEVYDTTGWLESTTPTFYITGVQLEVGTVATPFEHISYGEELALCQRYYEVGNILAGSNLLMYCGDVTSGVDYYASIRFMTQKRAAPTITNTYRDNRFFPTSAGTTGAIDPIAFRIAKTANGTGTGGYYSDDWTADAEL